MIKNVIKLERKFNTNFRDFHWLKCYFRNHACYCYFIVHDDYFEIQKFSMFTGGRKGFLKIYFEDISSIDVVRKRLFRKAKLFISVKSGVVYRFQDDPGGPKIKEKDSDLVMNVFNNYKLSKNNNYYNKDFSKIVEYAELYEKGLLTKEEFKAVKKELL